MPAFTFIVLPTVPPALLEPLATEATAALVRGPTAPYPVVFGAPYEMMPFAAWNFLTATSVSGPKYAVAESAESNFCAMRNCCSAKTSSPRIPKESVRVRSFDGAGVSCDGVTAVPGAFSARSCVRSVWSCFTCARSAAICAAFDVSETAGDGDVPVLVGGVGAAVGFGVVGAGFAAAAQRASASRVAGPVTPQPVVEGVPDETMLRLFCQSWSAVCV